MSLLRWIHLSDIHINRVGVDNKRMRDKLINYFKEQSIKCDYLFITGDLKYAPESSYSIEDTVQYITELCNVLNVNKENLFIVPGNHDINRDYAGRNETVNKIVGRQGVL